MLILFTPREEFMNVEGFLFSLGLGLGRGCPFSPVMRPELSQLAEKWFLCELEVPGPGFSPML